jgi:UDP-N-acetylmuramate--alanine ligase
VAEADESDASFLHLQPLISVVTNIDNDHLGTHDGDFNRLRQSFVDFLHNLPFYGLAVLCVDDAEVRGILPKVGRPITTYGFEANADIRAVNVQRQGLQTSYEVVRPGHSEPLAITVNLPGRHNVLNSLAAVAVASELGIDDAAIQRALAKFQGVDRRLQFVGTVPAGQGEAVVIDDYGHHPTEIRATLDAVRQAYPGRRVVLAFQPHRYTRTRDLLDDFAGVLSTADVLLVSEVYAAGEAPIPGADGRAICRAVRSRGHIEPVFLPRIEELGDVLAELLRAGDVVLAMGAGTVSGVAHDLPQRLGGRAAGREEVK